MPLYLAYLNTVQQKTEGSPLLWVRGFWGIPTGFLWIWIIWRFRSNPHGRRQRWPQRNARRVMPYVCVSSPALHASCCRQMFRAFGRRQSVSWCSCGIRQSNEHNGCNISSQSRRRINAWFEYPVYRTVYTQLVEVGSKHGRQVDLTALPWGVRHVGGDKALYPRHPELDNAGLTPPSMIARRHTPGQSLLAGASDRNRTFAPRAPPPLSGHFPPWFPLFKRNSLTNFILNPNRELISSANFLVHLSSVRTMGIMFGVKWPPC